MLQGPVTWAASKLMAYLFPVDTSPRPRSTLDESDPAETLDSHAWRNRDESRRSHRGAAIQHTGFKPQYLPLLHQPRNDLEAQQLYNHIRTIAWYLDSIPILGSRLPFNVGIESIVGLVPGVGDSVGLLFGLYQVVICSLFGLPVPVLLWMLFNILIDCLMGIVPVIGDALDVLFQGQHAESATVGGSHAPIGRQVWCGCLLHRVPTQRQVFAQGRRGASITTIATIAACLRLLAQVSSAQHCRSRTHKGGGNILSEPSVIVGCRTNICP